MTAGATLTLVWLGAGAPQGRPPAPAAEVLHAWSQARGVALEIAREEAVSADETLQGSADRCEELLTQARDLTNEGDDAGAGRRLFAVEQLLREQTRLPQAAWLMAERWRLEAELETHAGNRDRARELQLRAEVLEGARAVPFGRTERADAPPSPALVPVTLAIRGARRHQAYWDGLPAPDDRKLPPGEHHLAIFRGGRVRWSGWVSVAGGSKIDLWIPEAVPCSREDLDEVHTEGDRLVVPPGVGCGGWATAMAGTRPDSIRIARCERGGCESLREWSSRPALAAGATTPEHRGGFPTWAAWTLAGAGALGVSAIVLWRLGVFDAPGQRTVTTYDGGHL